MLYKNDDDNDDDDDDGYDDRPPCQTKQRHRVMTHSNLL